jgi:hypothetical protein
VEFINIQAIFLSRICQLNPEFYKNNSGKEVRVF